MADSELTWSTQADWDAATERHRVVTRDIGSRDPSTLQLGFDPEYGPVADALNYWPLDEQDGATTFIDEIGGYNGTLALDDGSMNYRQPGPLGTYAIDGNGDSVELGEVDTFRHAGNFTIFAWIEQYQDSGFDTALVTQTGKGKEGSIRLEIRSDDRAFGYYYGPQGDIYTTKYFDAGVGKPLPIVLRLVQGDETLLYIHTPSETVTQQDYYGPFPDRPEPSFSDNAAHIANLYDAGGRSNFKYLSDIIYWDRALDRSEVDEVLDTFKSGMLVTDWRSEINRAEELTVSANTPGPTGGSVTVEQDTDSDGMADRSEEVVLADGTNTVDLDRFVQSASSQYRLRFELSTGSVYETPTVSYATIGLNPVNNSVWDVEDGAVKVTNGVFETTI